MKVTRFSPSTIISVIIISLAVSPAFALGTDQKNMLLIGVMAFSPLLIFLFENFKNKFDRKDMFLILFLSSLILFQYLVNPEKIRWSTIIYTMMFGFTFIAYKQLLNRNYFTIKDYQNLLKYLIIAYAIVLLIQQFCVLTGLPIFNVSNYHPTDKWKLNTLTSEPSHSARVVGLLMYCYISVIELVMKRKYNFRLDFKNDKWVWMSFIWTMVSMGSGTAFLFIPLILLKFVRFKNIIPILILFSSIYFVTDIFGITSFDRAYKTVLATLTLNPSVIIEADHSAAFRIVPMIILAQRIGLSTLNDWFGFGIDYVSSFLSSEVPGLPEGWTGGGLFQLWVDFGFISFLLFLIFNFFEVLKKGDYLSYIFWFMLVFIQGINNQIVWLCIVLLFTNIYFQKISKRRNIYRLKSEYNKECEKI